MGEDAQFKMLIEECAELIVAVAKLGRAKNGNTLLNVAEEVADVEICLAQVKQMYPFIAEQAEHEKVVKYARLEQLLEKR